MNDHNVGDFCTTFSFTLDKEVLVEIIHSPCRDIDGGIYSVRCSDPSLAEPEIWGRRGSELHPLTQRFMARGLAQ